MKNKKILSIVLLFLTVLVLVGCQKKSLVVEFDSRGGTAVAKQEVKVDGFAVEPETDPTRASWTFTGWYSTEAGAAANDQTLLFNFGTKITENKTLFAGWTQNVVVRFKTRTTEIIPMVDLGEAGGTVNAAPTAPTRSGWKFGGWFTSKRGLTWQEPTAVQFPLTVTKATVLFAYWEPVDSVAVNWTEGETYRSSILEQSRMILNPLTYENNLEDALIANLATALYSTEVDWDKAMAQGVADFPGDFSKIVAGEFSVESLDYANILVGAAAFPKNKDGDEMLDENGKYDRVAATTNTSTEWTFTLRDDIFFQDGRQVDASVYEFSLKQYLDKEQNNDRANGYYKTEENKNGYPIVNAFEYFSQSVAKLGEDGKPLKDEEGKTIYEPATITWEQVGFKVIDKYTFKLVFHEPVTQASAVGFGTNFRLVHPEKYAASLTGGNSTYGTPESPYMSYGPYVLKTWDEGTKLVFNKNYNYVLKGTINYKSIAYEIVENNDVALQLFRDGRIDVIGLDSNNYAEFAESKNIFKSYEGYPHFMSINTAPSTATVDKHEHATILYDADFRQALLFGLDRVYYTNNVDVPNEPSFLPVPADIKSYVQDQRRYVESPQHLEVLEELGIDPESQGYAPTKAVQLFNTAYAKWLAEGNQGPVTLKLIAPDTVLQRLKTAYIKEAYETLFADAQGNKRLIIDVKHLNSEQRSLENRTWNFDLALHGVGFGGSLGVFWQYGAIAFFGGAFGGSQLGLSQPYTTDPETGERIEAPYVNEVIEIELMATYNYLAELGEEGLASSPEAFTQMYEMLMEQVDEETGEVVKPAGLFRETVETAAYLMMESNPWDATAEEPFAGALDDVWTFVAALERVFYKHVTHIPTAVSASATLYADKVTILWPDYSTAFGWGANRYRYLNTDPDFRA